MTKEKIEQQLEMIESLVADVRKSYGIDKKRAETDTDKESKLEPQLDTTFKDVVKIRKEQQNLINGGY